MDDGDRRTYDAQVSDATSWNNQEPERHEPSGARRWAAYLDWLREDLIRAVLALSDLQQRDMRVPSGWSPLELLNHVLHMEQRWFVWGFLGETVERPWGDWNQPEPWTSDHSDELKPAARWQVPDGVRAEDLAEQLRAVGERTRAAVIEHPLDARGARGGRFAEDAPTLEWICFHVLAEYARHAGHLDVSTEILG